MVDVNQSVALPASAAALGQALSQFVLDLVAAHKAGGGAVAEASADVAAALKDFSPALSALGGLSGDFASEPLGVAEAFALAGFQIGRALSGK